MMPNNNNFHYQNQSCDPNFYDYSNDDRNAYLNFDDNNLWQQEYPYMTYVDPQYYQYYQYYWAPDEKFQQHNPHQPINIPSQQNMYHRGHPPPYRRRRHYDANHYNPSNRGPFRRNTLHLSDIYRPNYEENEPESDESDDDENNDTQNNKRPKKKIRGSEIVDKETESVEKNLPTETSTENCDSKLLENENSNTKSPENNNEKTIIDVDTLCKDIKKVIKDINKTKDEEQTNENDDQTLLDLLSSGDDELLCGFHIDKNKSYLNINVDAKNTKSNDKIEPKCDEQNTKSKSESKTHKSKKRKSGSPKREESGNSAFCKPQKKERKISASENHKELFSSPTHKSHSSHKKDSKSPKREERTSTDKKICKEQSNSIASTSKISESPRHEEQTPSNSPSSCKPQENDKKISKSIKSTNKTHQQKKEEKPKEKIDSIKKDGKLKTKKKILPANVARYCKEQAKEIQTTRKLQDVGLNFLPEVNYKLKDPRSAKTKKFNNIEETKLKKPVQQKSENDVLGKNPKVDATSSGKVDKKVAEKKHRANSTSSVDHIEIDNLNTSSSLLKEFVSKKHKPKIIIESPLSFIQPAKIQSRRQTYSCDDRIEIDEAINETRKNMPSLNEEPKQQQQHPGPIKKRRKSIDVPRKQKILIEKNATEVNVSIAYGECKNIPSITQKRSARCLIAENCCAEEAIVILLRDEIKNDQTVVQQKVKEENKESAAVAEPQESITLYRSEETVNNHEDVQQMTDTVVIDQTNINIVEANVNKNVVVPLPNYIVNLVPTQNNNLPPQVSITQQQQPISQLQQRLLNPPLNIQTPINNQSVSKSVPKKAPRAGMPRQQSNLTTIHESSTTTTPQTMSNLRVVPVENNGMLPSTSSQANTQLNIVTNPAPPPPSVPSQNLNSLRLVRIVRVEDNENLPSTSSHANTQLNTRQSQVNTIANPPPPSVPPKRAKIKSTIVQDMVVSELSEMIKNSLHCFWKLNDLYKYNSNVLKSVKFPNCAEFASKEYKHYSEFIMKRMENVGIELVHSLHNKTKNMIWQNMYFRRIFDKVYEGMRKYYPDAKITPMNIYSTSEKIFSYAKSIMNDTGNIFIKYLYVSLTQAIEQIETMRKYQVFNREQRALLQKQILVYNDIVNKQKMLLQAQEEVKKNMMQSFIQQQQELMQQQQELQRQQQQQKIQLLQENFRIRLPLAVPRNDTNRKDDAKEEDDDDDDIIWLDTLEENQMEKEIKLIPIMEMVKSERNINIAALSPADSSGTGSPPLQLGPMELYKDRICSCGKNAQMICKCTHAMYCSTECQNENWEVHRQICVAELNQKVLDP